MGHSSKVEPKENNLRKKRVGRDEAEADESNRPPPPKVPRTDGVEEEGEEEKDKEGVTGAVEGKEKDKDQVSGQRELLFRGILCCLPCLSD